MANITVKKNDGTTDIVYTGVVPSAGDKSAAVWRSNTVGSAPAHRPELQLNSQWNGPRTARRISGKYTYPVTAVGSDGKTNVVDRGFIEFSGLVPQTMSDTDINEMVSQGANLVGSTLIKTSFKEGYAPT
jgi:hypothetical protein